MLGRWHLFLFGARPISWVSGSVLPTENPPWCSRATFRKFQPSLRPKNSTRNSSKMAHLWCHLRVGSTFDWQFGMGCWCITMAALNSKRNEKQTLTRWKCGRLFFFGSFHSWFLCEFSCFFSRFWGAHSGSLTNHMQPMKNDSWKTLGW